MTQNGKEAKRKKDFPEMFDRYAKALGEIAEQIASAKSYREMKHPSVEEFLSQKQISV